MTQDFLVEVKQMSGKFENEGWLEMTAKSVNNILFTVLTSIRADNLEVILIILFCPVFLKYETSSEIHLRPFKPSEGRSYMSYTFTYDNNIHMY